MLGFARDSARMATDAHILIDDKAVPQRGLQTVAGLTRSFLVERASQSQSGLHQDEVELRVFLELLFE